MDMFLIWLYLFFLVSVGMKCNADDCSKGPKYWCKNKQTAQECGAIAICDFENGSSTQQQLGPKSSNTYTSPVNITLYYESLCPDCKDAWNNQLYPTFQKLQSSGILNVDLVPYGNAQEREYGSQWIYYCQHGAAECTGNVIETCAIRLYPDQSKYVPFVYCLEYYGPTLQNAKYCASIHQMDYSRIESCSQGSDGNKYEHEMALKTNVLNPPHTSVPWYTLNGYHTDSIQQQLINNMLNYVCSVYTGTKPQACFN